MAKFVKGDIVVVPFPFSDLSKAKRRPAIVIAAPLGVDPILCQITSQTIKDNYAVTLTSSDFASGSLPKESNVRPNKIFTADAGIILGTVGKANDIFMKALSKKLIQIFSE